MFERADSNNYTNIKIFPIACEMTVNGVEQYKQFFSVVIRIFDLMFLVDALASLCFMIRSIL